MLLPGIVLLLTLVLHAGLVGLDLVVAQGLAREAARTAAVDSDEAVRQALDAAAGRRPVELRVDPPAARRQPGETVTVRLRVRSRAFAAFGAHVWLPAEATMRVEHR